jgi:hypothetical protein
MPGCREGLGHPGDRGRGGRQATGIQPMSTETTSQTAAVRPNSGRSAAFALAATSSTSSSEGRRREVLRPRVENVCATYREALRTELQAAGIATDDDLVHFVFAAVDGLVFQRVCLGGPAAAQGALARLRTPLSHLR